MNKIEYIHCRVDNYIYLNQFQGQKCEIVHIHQKPQLGPKPGQAKPDLWLWAQLTISSSPSHLKPGWSWGFRAKPELTYHYLVLMPFDVPLLSLEFGWRCRVRSCVRCWLQLVGCAALLMDASNFGGPDGVKESRVKPRRSLRKARTS